MVSIWVLSWVAATPCHPCARGNLVSMRFIPTIQNLLIENIIQSYDRSLALIFITSMVTYDTTDTTDTIDSIDTMILLLQQDKC